MVLHFDVECGFNKICLFNKSTFGFITTIANNSLRVLSEPITNYHDLIFAKAYIECWGKISKERIECLISLKKNRRTPIYILAGIIDNQSDIETAKKNNIFFIAPPTEGNFHECLSDIETPDINHNEPHLYAFEHGKILSPGAEDRIKKCLCLEKIDPSLATCIKQAAEKTKYWTISNECMQKVLSQCTINHWTPQMLSIRKEEDWVKWWKNYLIDSKGKHSYEDIIRGLPDGQIYPGTGYAGLGVLFHIAKSLGGWSQLNDHLIGTVPRDIMISRANTLLKEINKNKDQYVVFFLHKNTGSKQVQPNSPSFNLLLDYRIDFILVDTDKKRVLAPDRNELPSLTDITDIIDNKNKEIILSSMAGKIGKSKAGQKGKPSKKK